MKLAIGNALVFGNGVNIPIEMSGLFGEFPSFETKTFSGVFSQQSGTSIWVPNLAVIDDVNIFLDGFLGEAWKSQILYLADDLESSSQVNAGVYRTWKALFPAARDIATPHATSGYIYYGADNTSTQRANFDNWRREIPQNKGKLPLSSCFSTATGTDTQKTYVYFPVYPSDWLDKEGSIAIPDTKVYDIPLITMTLSWTYTSSRGDLSISMSSISVWFTDAEIRAWGDLPLTVWDEDGDPYDKGGDSAPGGGGGSYSRPDSQVGFSSLPSLSAVDTGLVTLYNPSLTQVRQIASYLWSDAFSLDSFKKLFADPMDAVLGFSIVPVDVPSGTVRELSVGNIGTGISVTTAASQYVEVDCGSVQVERYFNSYLDHSPYTQMGLFLPYIGYRPINADDVMNKSVHIKYFVDILTGACNAQVVCGGNCLYEYNGQCSVPVPLTSINWASTYRAVLGTIAGVATGFNGGGMTGAIGPTASIASTVMGGKPEIQRSGNMGSSSGLLGHQKPYFVYSTPRQAKPADQNAFLGYPSFITTRLGDLSGYTEVEQVHLDGISATDTEIKEIEDILKSGVIF